jgi:four helix bundle protein
MLRIYLDIQLMQDDARRLCGLIGAHDANLASQLRRSAQSVALNTAEGMAASGGVRRNAYSIAAREARECVAAIDVAVRWGYVDMEAAVVDRLEKIVGTLMRLTMPRR